MYADTVIGLILGGLALFFGFGEGDKILKIFGSVVLIGTLSYSEYRANVIMPSLINDFNNGKELYCGGGRGSGTTIVSKSGGWVIEDDNFANMNLSMLIRIINCATKEDN